MRHYDQQPDNTQVAAFKRLTEAFVSVAEHCQILDDNRWRGGNYDKLQRLTVETAIDREAGPDGRALETTVIEGSYKEDNIFRGIFDEDDSEMADFQWESDAKTGAPLRFLAEFSEAGSNTTKLYTCEFDGKTTFDLASAKDMIVHFTRVVAQVSSSTENQVMDLLEGQTLPAKAKASLDRTKDSHSLTQRATIVAAYVTSEAELAAMPRAA